MDAPGRCPYRHSMSAGIEQPGSLAVRWYTRMPPAWPDAEYGIGPERGGDLSYVAWLAGSGELTILPVHPSGRVPRRREDGEPVTDPGVTDRVRTAIDKYSLLAPNPRKDKLKVAAAESRPPEDPLSEGRTRYALTGSAGGPVLYYADVEWYDWRRGGFWPRVESADGEILYESAGAAPYDPLAGGNTEIAARVHAAIGRYLYQDADRQLRRV